MRHIDHRHIAKFAERHVNLDRETASKYRQQIRRLSEELQGHLSRSPSFSLRKMLLSGSLAKHTALKTINDGDVAMYVEAAPESVWKLTRWLAEKMRTAFPNLRPEQVEIQDYSVRIDFRGTRLSVDVVPVYAEKGEAGDDDWGVVVSQKEGMTLRTNIRLHKEFIKKRRVNNPDFAQVVRLVKWWIRARKAEDNRFKFKSFMAELILTHLIDNGEPIKDYPEAMIAFFDYIAKDQFKSSIYFRDYPEGLPQSQGLRQDAIRIFDPVNGANNVARKYQESDRMLIISSAIDAGDAIEAALHARTRHESIHYWRKIFGPVFSE